MIEEEERPTREFTGPDKLLEAMGELARQEVRTAYFCLISFEIPEFPVFLPDGKGGGYVFLDRKTTMYVDVPLEAIELDTLGVQVKAEDKQIVENYPDAVWALVREALQAYVLPADRWEGFHREYAEFDEVDYDERMILEFTGADAEFFLKTLVEEAWGSSLDSFRYHLKWFPLTE